MYQAGGVLSGMINPVYSSEWKPNDLDSELDRLKIGFDKPPETIPNTGGKYLFSPREYHDYAERAGKIAKANIEKVMKTAKYKKSNDLMKEARIRNAYDAAKTQAWAWLYNESKHKDEMQRVIELAITARRKELTE